MLHVCKAMNLDQTDHYDSVMDLLFLHFFYSLSSSLFILGFEKYYSFLISYPFDAMNKTTFSFSNFSTSALKKGRVYE
jgi:hypothetical protein